jgi:hypothetical protein
VLVISGGQVTRYGVAYPVTHWLRKDGRGWRVTRFVCALEPLGAVSAWRPTLRAALGFLWAGRIDTGMAALDVETRDYLRGLLDEEQRPREPAWRKMR